MVDELDKVATEVGNALQQKKWRITTAESCTGGGIGFAITAEGVENEDQLSFLKSRHCDEAQGFYLSRPLPVDEVEAFIRRRREEQ